MTVRNEDVVVVTGASDWAADEAYVLEKRKDASSEWFNAVGANEAHGGVVMSCTAVKRVLG